MNTKEYIESGNLEAYALGSLPPDEAGKVAEILNANAELRAELALIEKTMLVFATSLAPALPTNFADKIWQEASSNVDYKTATNAGGTDKTIPLQTNHYKQPFAWKYAATWVALLGSVALNVMLWNNSSKTETQNVAMQLQMDTLQLQQQQLTSLIEGYQKAKNMMADTAMKTIVLHTMQKGHPMAATLYWSQEKAEAYVSVDGMPPPPPGMQYQLWAIQNGKPVDMGVLPNNMANTPNIRKVGMRVTNGEAFAISLEKEGGSPVPTMENIYVMGKA